jgi:glycosyltransferase involved in cell wall biosynthesis
MPSKIEGRVERLATSAAMTFAEEMLATSLRRLVCMAWSVPLKRTLAMNVMERAAANSGTALGESTTSSASIASRTAGPRPYRILYIEANEDGTVGGSHRVLFDLVCNLDRTQYEPVILFYQNNTYVSRLRAHGVDVLVLEDVRARERAIRRHGSRLAKHRENFATIVRRFRFLRQHRIDLIHINNSPLTGNDDWLPAARILRIPIVSSVAGDARGPGGGWLHKRLFRAFDHYLSVSDFINQAMLRAGIKSDRMDLIYPGVDLEPFRARVKRTREEVRRELGIPGHAVMALMVGNVRQWKGQHVVLAALEQMPTTARDGFYVAFAGALTVDDRPYMTELEATVKRAGVADHVKFLGGRDDVPDLLNASDIALHASVRPEPFGLVVVEAMSLGKTVVAANSGGPAEVVDRSSGVTFDPMVPGQLAEVLTDLVRDPIRRGELGKGALQRAEQFTARRYAAGVHRVYERVLPARSAGASRSAMSLKQDLRPHSQR